MPFFVNNGVGAADFSRGGTQWATDNHTIFATDAAYESYLSGLPTRNSAFRENKVFVTAADISDSPAINTFVNLTSNLTEVVNSSNIHSNGTLTIPSSGGWQLGISSRIQAIPNTNYFDNFYCGYSVNGQNELITVYQIVVEANNNDFLLTVNYAGSTVAFLAEGSILVPQIYVGAGPNARYIRTRTSFWLEPWY